ncbi:CDP-glycerol glycerophosphotransferase family protein [Chloroflexota bacterium]
MGKKKVVYLGSSAADITAQLDKIREYEQKPDWQAVVVATGFDAQRVCEQHGIPFKTTIDYLTTERHYRAFTESVRLAKEWYKHPVIEKALSHDGVSLCEMMEYKLWLLFGGFFLDVELYQGILETEKPDRVNLIKRPVPEPVPQNPSDMGIQESFIVGSLSDEKGISLEWITPIPASEGTVLRTVLRIVERSFLYQVLSYARSKAVDFIGQILFLNWRREVRREFQRLWNFCFCSWTSRRPMRIFSQKKRKIAFYGLRCAENIADYLRKDVSNGVICLIGPGQKRRVRSFVSQIYMESFNTPEIDRIVEEKRRVFRGSLEQTEAVHYLEKELCYNGFYFLAITRKKLEYLLEVQFPLMVRGMELMKEMINRIGLDIVISSADVDPVNSAMVRTLQLKGKKALCIQHGLDYFGLEASESFGKYMVPLVADKLAAWGEASRGWFISHGAPPARVEATSCSDFDDYIRIINSSKASVRRYLGIPPDKKVILYVLEHDNRQSRHPSVGLTRDEIIQNLKDVINEIACFPRLHLIVRPHPGDINPEEIRHVVQNGGQTNIICSSSPLIYQLQAIDILVTCSSSTALEAMIFDKDVIIYNPTGRPELVPYAQDGAALKVERKEDLVPTIIKVLGDDSPWVKLAKERKEFVSRCAGSIDGKATETIANLILEMINTKASGNSL